MDPSNGREMRYLGRRSLCKVVVEPVDYDLQHLGVGRYLVGLSKESIEEGQPPA